MWCLFYIRLIYINIFGGNLSIFNEITKKGNDNITFNKHSVQSMQDKREAQNFIIKPAF